MSTSPPEWSGSPEKRILRELRETKEGGLAPNKGKGKEIGRVFETILTRELQMLARQQTNIELRFARGYVVENYGNPESGEVSLDSEETVQKGDRRFDIVCYHGNVAWSSFEGFPVAVVPKSLAYGVIEAKRTITPKRFGPDSNEHYNDQLSDQRDDLRQIGADILQIVVGAHFHGTPEENRRRALADHVAVIGDLNEKPSLSGMACDEELDTVIDILSGEKSVNEADEKTKNLQNIANDLMEDNSDEELNG